MTLVWCTAAWLVGLWLAARATVPVPALVVAATAGATTAGAGWDRPTVRHASLILAAVALGVLRAYADAPAGPEALSAYHGQAATLTGWVSAEPVELARHTRLQLRVESIQPAPDRHPRSPDVDDAGADSVATARSIQGEVLAVVLNGPPRRYGERLELTGRLEAPPIFDGFAYRDYLARQGIGTLLRFPRVRSLPGTAGEPAWGAIYAVKAAVRESIVRNVAEPEAGLLVGVLLGSRAAMPADLQDAFAATNTTHLLAISGWNITIVAGWTGALAGVLTRGRRFPRAVLVAAAIGLYTVFVGMGASVVRAALMGSVALLGTATGRPRDALTALAAAALAMTAWDPSVLWDIGFQLSCLATLGIVLYATPIARWLGGQRAAGTPPGRWRLPEWLATAVSVTLAAEATTTPILAADFHRLSLVGLFANLSLEWTMAPIMVTGALVGVLGLAPPLAPIAWLVGWIAWAFSAVLIEGVRWYAALPAATLDVGEVDARVLLGWYGALAAVTLLAEPGPRAALSRVRSGVHPVVGVLAVWCLVWLAVLALIAVAPAEPPARIDFMRLGTADALLIRAPDGATVLVDTGSTPGDAVAALGRRLPAWSRRVDLVLLTDDTPVTAAGLPELMRRYDVGTVLSPAGSSGRVQAIRPRIVSPQPEAAAGVAERGAVWRVGAGGILRLLSTRDSASAPPGPTTALAAASRQSDTSTIAQITAWRFDVGQLGLLWLDDLSDEATRELYATGAPLGAELLRLPPRGRVSAELLAAVDPRVIVVPETGRSGATDPLAGLPAELLERAEVWRTGSEGTISVQRDDAGVRIRRLR